MAAIVLRRNFASLWQAAAPPSQAQFKQMVTEALSREQHDQVANAVAALTSQVWLLTFKKISSFYVIEEFRRRQYLFFLNPVVGLSCCHFCRSASLKADQS